MNEMLLILADVCLIFSGVFYGLKFMAKKNYLCGLEWLIMATSGTNFLLWAIFGWQYCYDAAHFFDAFSRSVGFPVVVVLGMMAVTHGYRPSKLADAIYFVLGFAAAALLVVADGRPDWVIYKPPFYLVMMAVFVLYSIYLIYKLLSFGEWLHTFGMLLVLLSGGAIGIIYDYFHIPGDDEYRTIFYTAALSSWAFMMFELYCVYCVLERRLDPSLSRKTGGTPHSNAFDRASSISKGKFHVN